MCLFFNLFALCCCCFDVINLSFAVHVHRKNKWKRGAQTKKQRWMFPESSLALRPPRSATSGRMIWALRRITDARHYFHLELEFHRSSFSLSVILVDYKLGLILILLDISFICDNSTIFPELMVERSKSHISCKKKSDWIESAEPNGNRKAKYGFSSLTKFHFQSSSLSLCFNEANVNNSWNTSVYSLYKPSEWKVFQSHHLSQPTRCCHHTMMGLVTKAQCAAVSSPRHTSTLSTSHRGLERSELGSGVWGAGDQG